jgi:hypothetical protein
MKTEFQKCRTWGHAWEDFVPGVGEKRPASWGKRFSLLCTRCGTERHDVFDSLGQLSTRSYDYPNGYQLALDERPEMTELRLSLVLELREEANARYEAYEAKKHTRKKPATNGHGHRPKRQPVARKTRAHARA